MKHRKHLYRKSYAKWAMTGQRIETESMTKLMARRRKSKNPFQVGKPFKRSGQLRFGAKLD